MDQLVYFYNDDLRFDHVGVIPEGAAVPANATLSAPSGYEPFVFDKESNKWVGATKAEFNESHPDTESTPNQQEQINIALTQQLAQTKSELATANAGLIALTREVAEMKGAQA